MNSRVVITAAECITAVGLDARSTVAAIRAGVSGLHLSDQFDDRFGEPILEGSMPWLPADESPTSSVGPDEPPEEDEEEEDEPPDDDDEREDDEDDAVEWIVEAPIDDDDDRYELARQNDDLERVTGAARACVASLREQLTAGDRLSANQGTLFLGVATPERPGPRFEGEREELVDHLSRDLSGRIGSIRGSIIREGHAAAIEGLRQATQQIERDPASLHVIGGVDSLLDQDTLEWYEEAERLKSGTSGRQHGFAASEATGFFTITSARHASHASRVVFAEILGVGVAIEPNPFLSDRPCTARGLTDAVAAALADAGTPPSDIGTVLCDLDGEFHRSKEWALAEARCFGPDGHPELIHPADCLGTLGAASAAVLINVAAVGLSSGWFKKPVIVCCSDEAGFCGAVVIGPASRE